MKSLRGKRNTLSKMGLRKNYFTEPIGTALLIGFVWAKCLYFSIKSSTNQFRYNFDSVIENNTGNIYRLNKLTSSIDSIPKVWDVEDTYSKLLNQYQEIRTQNTVKGVDALLDLDGIVVDETQSKMGKDFYDIFFRLWDSPKHEVNYSIVIGEKPMPSLGTQIIVKVNDRIVFQDFLKPKYDAIENSAIHAVEYAKYFLNIYHQANFY